MRLANLAGRLVLTTGDRALDVEAASAGRFSSDPQAAFAHWDEFREWAGTVDLSAATPFDPHELGSPVPRPPQLFAIGLNYRDHAEEVGLDVELPVVFTKYVSSIT